MGNICIPTSKQFSDNSSQTINPPKSYKNNSTQIFINPTSDSNQLELTNLINPPLNSSLLNLLTQYHPLNEDQSNDHYFLSFNFIINNLLNTSYINVTQPRDDYIGDDYIDNFITLLSWSNNMFINKNNILISIKQTSINDNEFFDLFLTFINPNTNEEIEHHIKSLSINILVRITLELSTSSFIIHYTQNNNSSNLNHETLSYNFEKPLQKIFNDEFIPNINICEHPFINILSLQLSKIN